MTKKHCMSIGYTLVLALMIASSASAPARAAAASSSPTTSTTHAIDYNNVECFSNADCLAPMRGAAYCLGNSAVRDVTYGICENPLTEESRCVKSTNTTTIQECGDGRECQKGRCISLETSSAAEAPVQQTQEPEDMQTTSTSLESPQPSQQTVPTTVIAQTTSSTQPDTNKQADQPKSGNSLFLWVIMTVVLTLLILIAVVAAALALYLVYKRRIRSPEGNKRTMFSSAKNRSRL